VRERSSRCSRSGIDKGQRISCSVAIREGGVRLRVGREPEDRHIVRLLYSGEEGVDASDHSLVCHWLDGPHGKQCDAVITVGDNVVSGANHW